MMNKKHELEKAGWTQDENEKEFWWPPDEYGTALTKEKAWKRLLKEKKKTLPKS